MTFYISPNCEYIDDQWVFKILDFKTNEYYWISEPALQDKLKKMRGNQHIYTILLYQKRYVKKQKD